MSQRDGYNWSNGCLGKETAMPFTKPMARNSSATVPKYVYRQLLYLDDVHLLISASKLLPQLYFNGAVGPFGNSFFNFGRFTPGESPPLILPQVNQTTIG